MLVEFRFSNFRSFRDPAALSMVAASKLHADPLLDQANVFSGRSRPQLDLLRVAALYGANGGGKSNVIHALQCFLQTVVASANVRHQFGDFPFLLDEDSNRRPVHFEITFLREGTSFRYGFDVLVHDEGHTITAEWLYQATAATEAMLFERTGNTVRRSRRFTEGGALLSTGSLGRSDALFLSLAAQFGGRICLSLVELLDSRLLIIPAPDDRSLFNSTHDSLKQGAGLTAISRLMREADTGITSLGLLKDGTELPGMLPVSELPEELREEYRQEMHREFGLVAVHPIFDAAGRQVGERPLTFRRFESHGTQRLFGLAGPVLHALATGSTICIDEIDARLHPLLTRAIVRLFQSPETNPKNSQLIFTTHDTNLLDAASFRRDQLWFVEKDRFGCSHLYSLADFKGIRKHDPYERDYLQGRFGATPFGGGLDQLVETSGASGNGAEPLLPAEPSYAGA